MKKEGKFNWVSGEKTTEEFWNVNEPNNLGNEDCVQIVQNKGWNDGRCSLELPFICEN